MNKTIKATDELNDMKLYSLTEVEGVLGVCHRTLLRYVTAGKLKAVKVGGKWKVSQGVLRDFLDGCRNG